MNDFQYYFILGCIILYIMSTVLLFIYFYLRRKYNDNSYMQEMLAFIYSHTLLICVVLFTIVMVILYKYIN